MSNGEHVDGPQLAAGMARLREDRGTAGVDPATDQWFAERSSPPRAQRDAAPDSYQVGGDHYTALAVQPWQAMRAWMSLEQYRGFLRGNAIKYLARAGRKGDAAAEVDDLKKAQHYLAELIETQTQHAG